MKIKQAVILCGGMGKRLMPLTKNIPKPMVSVNGKPFLNYLISDLKKMGFNKILLLIGYKSEKIKIYLKNYKSLNIDIKYHEGPVEWETGKRIFESKNLINKNFLLLYSDNIFSFNYHKLITNYHNEDLFFILKKKNPGNFSLKNNMIDKYSLDRKPEHNFIELGFMICKKKPMIDFLSKKKNISINYYFYNRVKHRSCGYICHEDIYRSIGDIKRYQFTKKYLKQKRILFIDRDGTINQNPGKGKYLISDKNIKYVRDNINLLKSLSKKKFKFIIISNQAGISLKKLNLNQLKKINNKIKIYLKKNGIKVLEISTCIHHWNDNCDCRKPKPGMFYKVSAKYNINLSKTIFFGDDIRDMQAAQNANCKGIFYSQNKKQKGIYSLKNTILLSSKNPKLIEREIIKFYDN